MGIIINGTTDNVTASDGSWNATGLNNITGVSSISFLTQGTSFDAVFIENNQTVTANYTLTSGKNAMSAGPITIQSGVAVTIPSNQYWTIV